MAHRNELFYADHDWVRRQFFLLDQAQSTAELAAIWEPLAIRLDTHAQAEETIFYPALLKLGGTQGDPEDETDDAIGDHNKIRDAVRAAGEHETGSDAWVEAVGRARTENGEHLDEEEREGMPDFIKSTSRDLRHELAMTWLRFYREHPEGKGIDAGDRDVEGYIEENS